MNKALLVSAIAEKTGMTKAASNEALNALTGSISNELAKGGKVTIPGFGTFKTAHREARTGRNPQTGKEIKIAAKTVVRFKAGKGLEM